MNNPDEVLLKAILSLRNDNNFNIFMSWISDSLEEHKDALLDKADEKLSGMGLELRVICNTVKNAKEKLNRIESLQSRRPGS